MNITEIQGEGFRYAEDLGHVITKQDEWFVITWVEEEEQVHVKHVHESCVWSCAMRPSA